jgi:hypothetical protein
VTSNEPACIIQGKPENVIDSHQRFNSGGTVDKALKIWKSDGSFTVQVQFKNAATSGPSNVGGANDQHSFRSRPSFTFPEPNVCLNTSILS